MKGRVTISTFQYPKVMNCPFLARLFYGIVWIRWLFFWLFVFLEGVQSWYDQHDGLSLSLVTLVCQPMHPFEKEMTIIEIKATLPSELPSKFAWNHPGKAPPGRVRIKLIIENPSLIFVINHISLISPTRKQRRHFEEDPFPPENLSEIVLKSLKSTSENRPFRRCLERNFRCSRRRHRWRVARGCASPRPHGAAADRGSAIEMLDFFLSFRREDTLWIC